MSTKVYGCIEEYNLIKKESGKPKNELPQSLYCSLPVRLILNECNWLIFLELAFDGTSDWLIIRWPNTVCN
jgi:hypothetical protein